MPGMPAASLAHRWNLSSLSQHSHPDAAASAPGDVEFGFLFTKGEETALVLPSALEQMGLAGAAGHALYASGACALRCQVAQPADGTQQGSAQREAREVCRGAQANTRRPGWQLQTHHTRVSASLDWSAAWVSNSSSTQEPATRNAEARTVRFSGAAGRRR